MDNLQSQQQQRRWNLIPVSPAQTPRSSQKAMRDSLSLSTDGNLGDKHDKGVNVQVILRCRPLNEDEMRVKSPVVISCNEHRRVVSVIQNTAYKQIDKTFAFDKVFGATSQQKELFDLVVTPIVNEMLEGYNCTIFAYGQTGTGKTYTMEGGRVDKNGEFPNDAGVIPRAVQQIFDILEAKNAEYSMRVTFLELYNEEIMDLLAPDESLGFLDDKPKKPITLMEDGRGCVYVRGLEQEVVCTADEIYKILEKGSARRRTGETLLNKQSSRSHTIFSVTTHIKESIPEGQELIKCGKLNLVDLAGSENILRSGAREGRAREAGEINKSLLTLGRVINALVEHSGHVPYRDSKLTRLLRDSLGGKTKTCIIATISPSILSLEETLNTLDYAHRAKNIKNKPEVNQRMIKSEFIKDLCTEIDGHRQEVYAAREKNGIYIPQERYLNEEAEKKAMAEKIKRMELKEFKDKQLVELQELYSDQKQLTAELSEKLDRTQKELEQTQHSLFDLEDRYRKAKATIKEKEDLVSNLLKSEKALMEQALELRTELENAGSEVSSLFTKVECKDKLADGNKILFQNFQTSLAKQLEVLHEMVAASVTQQEQQLKVMEEDMQSFVSRKARATKELLAQLTNLKGIYSSGFKSLDNLARKIDGNSQLAFRNLTLEVSGNSSSLVDLFKEMSLEANAILDDLQSNLSSQEEKLAAYAKEHSESHTRTYQMTKSISDSIMNFFETLSTHTMNLTQLMEDAQAINRKKSCELEKKFEECAAIEKRQLLEKVAELLESSNARKKKLVQMAVEDLFESTASGTCKLQQEMSNIQDFASSVKDKWTAYMGETETCYLNDKAAVESRKVGLEEGFRHCMTKARKNATQWRITQEGVFALQKRNIDSVNAFIKDGMETNHMISTKFSSAALSALEEADAANKPILYSIENSLQHAHDAHKNIYLITSTCSEDMNEMKSTHNHNILDIKENAGKHLVDEYRVDEPSCLAHKKRPITNIPRIASIELLRIPAFEHQ